MGTNLILALALALALVLAPNQPLFFRAFVLTLNFTLTFTPTPNVI